MRLPLLIWPFMAFCSRVQAKAVENSASFDVETWKTEIRKAHEAGIDAFALNIAHGGEGNDARISLAFQAANYLIQNENVVFKHFFSFDYAGLGAWPKAEVIQKLTEYGPNGAYYHRGSQPLVSTFEGPDNSADWTDIKTATNCYFIPDWSSKGAKAALALPGNAVSGLFNWAAWPDGPNDMTITIDSSYTYFLDQHKLSTYMMPVSPWFYTNLPGYCKNWLWRGDDLCWNDYGESHYVGTLYENELHAFAADKGNPPFNYAKGMPHEGWLEALPFVIGTYKNNISTVSQERISAWYRPNPARACGDGGTTGNNPAQLQDVYAPSDIVQDFIFFDAVLASTADVHVTVGGTLLDVYMTGQPEGGIGLYHGAAPYDNLVGPVEIKVFRNNVQVPGLSINGIDITRTCSTNGLSNWNAWTGSARGTNAVSATPPYRLEQQVCIEGNGDGDLQHLCAWSCQHGYCPPGVCTCSLMSGVPNKVTYNNPTVYGCPLPTLTSSYLGLCAFACNTGYCPPDQCIGGSTKRDCPVAADPPPPPESSTAPSTCTPISQQCNGGTGPDNFSGLCDYACARGHCPSPCTCLSHGTPVAATETARVGCPIDSMPTDDWDVYIDLCQFVCSRGYCPPTACMSWLATDTTLTRIPCKPADIPGPAFHGTAFSELDQRAAVYGFEDYVSPVVVHAPLWAFAQNPAGENSCYPESAIVLDNYPECLADKTCKPNPGTRVPPGLDPSDDCTDPTEDNILHGHYTIARPFPVYVGARYCGTDEWRLNFDIYYVHDGLLSTGHPNDWDSGITLVFGKAPNSNGADWWTVKAGIIAKHGWQNYFEWDELHTIDSYDDRETETSGGNKKHPKVYAAINSHAGHPTPNTIGWWDALLGRIEQANANTEFRRGNWCYMPQASDNWNFHIWSEIDPSWDYGDATGTPPNRIETMCSFDLTIGCGGEGCIDHGW